MDKKKSVSGVIAIPTHNIIANVASTGNKFTMTKPMLSRIDFIKRNVKRLANKIPIPIPINILTVKEYDPRSEM